jgi:hypothetical protein
MADWKVKVEPLPSEAERRGYELRDKVTRLVNGRPFVLIVGPLEEGQRQRLLQCLAQRMLFIHPCDVEGP